METDSRRFLPNPKKVRTSGGTYPRGTRAIAIAPRGSSSSELIRTRSAGFEEQGAPSPEGCLAKMPWNRHCFEDSLRMACEAMASDDMLALKAVDGMTVWSLHVLMDSQQQFTDCL